MPKNRTFKPLSTIFVPCLKIQGGHGLLPPAVDAHEYRLRLLAAPAQLKLYKTYLTSWNNSIFDSKLRTKERFG